MSIPPSDQLSALLQAAEKRPLSEAEQAMLQKLLKNDDNRLAASADRHLQENYIATGAERQWTAAELSQIANQVGQQTSHRTRRRRVVRGTQQLAWAAVALIAIIGFLALWSQINLPSIEPAAPITFTVTPTATATATVMPTMTPSPTPEPTPTLVDGYRYADLLTAPAQSFDPLSGEIYIQTVAEIAEQWSHDLYLPSQLPENWSFAGADINQEDEVLELAFVEDESVLWILSQATEAERPLNPPLPVTHQPLIRVDKINDYEDKAITVGELPAHAYQYEFEYKEGVVTEWEVYNTVTWQIDGQLFTLTHISQRLESSTLTAPTANNLTLQLQGIND